VQIQIDVPHRVPAHHHRSLGPGPVHERVCDCPESHSANKSRHVIVLLDWRMSVITHDPEVRVVPCVALFGISANLTNAVIYDLQSVIDVRA
jgi:hypothetical protein